MFKISLEEKKDAIGGVAADVFIEKGYQSATLQDIADKLEVSKAAIYHYFKTKEEILFHIFQSGGKVFIADLRNQLRTLHEANLGKKETLRQFIQFYMNGLYKGMPVPLLILRERHQLTGEYEAEIKRIDREIFELIRQEVRDLCNMSSQSENNLVSLVIISSSHWITYWLKEDSSYKISDTFERLADILCSGLYKD